MLHLCDVEIKAGGPPQPPLVAAAPCVSGSHEQVRLPLVTHYVPALQHALIELLAVQALGVLSDALAVPGVCLQLSATVIKRTAPIVMLFPSLIDRAAPRRCGRSTRRAGYAWPTAGSA